MPRPRRQLVCVDNTPYYHVMSRCVRRAFLCGTDERSGRNYEHRRSWIKHRIRVLSSLFSIEICAYAVMSNHYHIVVKLIPDEAKQWTEEQVLERWCALFRGTLLVQRHRNGEPLGEIEAQTLSATIAIYRSRLSSLSWFMKCLNEPIARQANSEDQCTGHFWEARFVSQALCTEQALLSAMAYVDLNPIRAGMATTPEQSDYTSIKARLNPGTTVDQLQRAIGQCLADGDIYHARLTLRPLAAFADESPTSSPEASDTPLPMRWPDYLTLVDVTGRTARTGKRGTIDKSLAPIIKRVGMNTAQWMQAANAFEQHYRGGVLKLASGS